MSHQYEISQLKLTALTERMEHNNELISFLFAAYKDQLRTDNRSIARVQEAGERPKVAKPISSRTLTRHHTVRHVGAAWTHDHEFKQSVRLERSITKASILEEHENIDLEHELPLRKQVKTVISGFQALSERFDSLFSFYQQHESRLSLLEQSIYTSHKKEMTQWTKLISEVQGNYERELRRKREEIRKLNGTMAVWVHRYLDLEQRVAGEGGEMTGRMKRVVEVMEKQLYATKRKTEVVQEQSHTSKQLCSIDLLPGDQAPSQVEDF